MTSPALAARARGLSSHLIDDDLLLAVERAPDRAALVLALGRAGFAPAALAGAAPAALERALRGRGQAERALLERWAGDEPEAVALLGDDEDRRTLRAVIRGVAANMPSTARLAAAMPTATLPERVLTALGAATSAAEVAEVLTACAHPAAPVVAPLLVTTPLDLLAIELALTGWFTGRARRYPVDHALASHVRQLIDIGNASAALLLSARGRELDAGAHFVDGGGRLDRTRYLATAAAPALTAAATLAPAFAGTPLAAALGPEPVTTPDALERAALQWHLATQTELRRREPLGLAPLLWLTLRRRLEGRRLRRAAWRLAMATASLGDPSTTLRVHGPSTMTLGVRGHGETSGSAFLGPRSQAHGPGGPEP